MRHTDITAWKSWRTCEVVHTSSEELHKSITLIISALSMADAVHVLVSVASILTLLPTVQHQCYIQC